MSFRFLKKGIKTHSFAYLLIISRKHHSFKKPHASQRGAEKRQAGLGNEKKDQKEKENGENRDQIQSREGKKIDSEREKSH